VLTVAIEKVNEVTNILCKFHLYKALRVSNWMRSFEHNAPSAGLPAKSALLERFNEVHCTMRESRVNLFQQRGNIICDPPQDFVELGERTHTACSHNRTKEHALDTIASCVLMMIIEQHLVGL